MAKTDGHLDEALNEVARLERAFDRVEIQTRIVPPSDHPACEETSDAPPTAANAPSDCDSRKPYAIAPLGEITPPDPDRPPVEITRPLIAYTGVTPAGSLIDLLV